jgi:LytS/YehU family sensor histidine kinase
VLHWLKVAYLGNLTVSSIPFAEKWKVNPRTGYTVLAYEMLEWFIIASLATFIHADRRETQRVLAILQAAQVQRSTQARQVLESQLQAMQARVEPQFLFNTLARIKQLYDIDAALGEQMLDDLIVYLRAAMPRMRDSSSTLAQEIALARAYLNIVKIRLADRLSFAIDVPDDIGDVRFPPMMLLPLIDHAMVHGVEQRKTKGTLHIASEMASGRLRVSIVDSGAGFSPVAGGDGIASIRERLVALYGEDAKLVLRERGADSTEAMVEVPYESIQENESMLDT